MKHYTKAAEKLCISQPSLSHAISQMEKELGVHLFEKDREKYYSYTIWNCYRSLYGFAYEIRYRCFRN